MMVEDEVAQKLEAAGLWRRAASRWLDVMQHHGLTDQQRDRIRQHRKYCLSCVKPISTLEKLDVTEIARAAKAAQERMGLSHPDGAAFRLKDEKITDFRHTMSTVLHEEGFDSAWIETQLAHVDKNAIREAYSHAQYLDRRKEMMQWYASFISNLSVTSV